MMQSINLQSIQSSVLSGKSAMYFGGRKRPIEVLLLRDSGGDVRYTSRHQSDDKNAILQTYFNDVYNMFLSRLTALVVANKISEHDSDRIRALLNEMIKVKGLIERNDGYEESVADGTRSTSI